MPLIAVNKSSGIRINMLETTPNIVRSQVKKGDLICPFCESQMHVVAGIVKTPHFRHNSTCSSSDVYKPESREHIAAKTYFYRKLKEKFANCPDVQIELEYRMSFVGKNGRIADIAQIHTNTGNIVAYEVQLSAIPPDQLSDRRNDYISAGIEDVWIFGGKMKEAISSYPYDSLPSQYIYLEFKYDQVRSVL
jgi:competence CoiA-like predicted nuclease